MLNGVSYAAAVVLAAQSAAALSPSNFYNAIVDKADMKATADYPSSVKVYNLSVPVDHFHDDPQYEPHSDAKFPVRYFLEASYYKPGGPVIVIASGETSAEDRVPYLNNGIGSHLAKATGGMVVSLEHRYYGTTFPVPNLSLENYRFLTTEQAVADAAYFAKNVQFPGFEDHNLTAPNTPWIIYGGSYAGAFAAFTRKLHPDAYWGAISSSGVTEAIYDYWEYNEAARLFAPGDCGPIMGKMTHVVDTALLSGNNTKVETVKQLFGFSFSVANPDFGDSISHPADALQGESWVRGQSDTRLKTYCATITSKKLMYPDLESSRPTAEKLVKDAGYCPDAATRFLNYVGLQRREGKERMKNGKCASASKADCVAAHMQKRGAQLNDGPSWPYQTCTQWGYYLSGEGVPKNILGLLSRAVTLEYAAGGCKTHFNITEPPNVDAINRLGGLEFSYPRVAVIDGKQDPWRAATPHKIGINEDRKSTTSEPFILIDYATHHWDEDDVPESEYEPGYPPKQIVDVHNQEVAFVKAWLKEFDATKA